jgi:hypothetical protein
MLLSKKKEKASHFRQQMRRCNQLHVEYMTDTRLRKSYERFTDWQLEYILPLFGDMYARPGYSEAIDFTMSDLAGIGISNRDRDLERAAPAITTILPLRALITVADTAEMNARVLEINIAIWRRLIAEIGPSAEITEYSYCIACREASSFGECLNLVHKITDLGKTLKSLVEVPMIGITLRAMKAPAHAAGFGALQEFLEKGFFTFRAIPDVDDFLAEIELHMIEIFKRIYTAPLDQLRR